VQADPINPLIDGKNTIAQLLLGSFPQRRQHCVFKLGADVADVPHLPHIEFTMVVETGSSSVIYFFGGSGCKGYSVIII
jgi:hypothetical protein